MTILWREIQLGLFGIIQSFDIFVSFFGWDISSGIRLEPNDDNDFSNLPTWGQDRISQILFCPLLEPGKACLLPSTNGHGKICQLPWRGLCFVVLDQGKPIAYTFFIMTAVDPKEFYLTACVTWKEQEENKPICPKTRQLQEGIWWQTMTVSNMYVEAEKIITSEIN